MAGVGRKKTSTKIKEAGKKKKSSAMKKMSPMMKKKSPMKKLSNSGKPSGMKKMGKKKTTIKGLGRKK